MGLWWANVLVAVFVVVPYAVLGVALWGAWAGARGGGTARRLFLFYPAVMGFLSGTALGIYGHVGILCSHSSTAAVGFFFLPFWMLGAAIVAWLVTALVLGAVHLAFAPRKNGRTGIIGVALAALLLTWGAGVWVRSRADAEKAASTRAISAARSPSLNAAQIPGLLGQAREGDLDLLLALASNPAMPTQGTANIYIYAERAPDSDPRKALILRALAENEHTPEMYLHELAKHQDAAVRDAALAALQRRRVP